MEETYEQQAGRYLRNSSVNVQVEFVVGWEGETLFALRATPWRNSSRPNRMCLVADDTLEGAIVLLAKEVEKQAWIPLDWRAKPVEIGVYSVEYAQPLSLPERVEKLRKEQAQQEQTQYNPTDPPKKGA
jgi:hypothetical protein